MDIRIIGELVHSLYDAAPQVRDVLDATGGTGASVRIKMDNGDTFLCLLEEDGQLRIEYLQKRFVEQTPSGDGFLQGCDPGDENDFGEAVR